jgi:hypothetical protein
MNLYLSSLLSRIPIKVVFLWLIIVVIGYYLTIPSIPRGDDKHLDYFTYSDHLQSAFITTKIRDYYPQAVVFISMGNISRESLVEDSIASVRSVGHWSGKIFIITDKPSCFEMLNLKLNAIVIKIPSRKNIKEIKKIKTEIFDFVPKEIDRVLYLDIDILVARSIGGFFQDLSHLLYLHHSAQIHQANKLIGKTNNTIAHQIDFASFLDAKGHYVGFCSGCEKWHTGVMYFKRGQSVHCLRAWGEILVSGRFQTDQESLDFAEKNGSCPNAVVIPSRHLLFAKDYIGMLLTSGQTFIHLTSANRVKETDYFYREFVVPRIRNSLHPPLKPYIPGFQKKC